MEKQNKIIMIVIALIGSIGDIISIIIGIQTMNIAVPFSVISFVALVSIIIVLFLRYRERSVFIKFIQYMFDNNFNVLPKVCLAVDKEKAQIGFKAKSLNIKYTYKMPEIDYIGVNKDTCIEYEDVIEYNFEFENKMIPKEFVCYLGNVNAKETLHVR